MAFSSRRDFLRGFAGALAASTVPSLAAGEPVQEAAITLEDARAAAKVLGVSFTDDELKAILNDLNQNVRGVGAVRSVAADPNLQPATSFRVLAASRPRASKVSVRTLSPVKLTKPKSEADLAFASLAELGALLRSKQVTSLELTELSLRRLKALGPQLRCVVSLTEERARREAKRADDEIKAGKWRGPLHGIPYGIKDLFASKGDRTTWGAAPYKDQVFAIDSAVVERLEAAGGVLVAKLSLGSLAMGDVWYEGRTESPWDPKIGSSGSSAGSAAATAAGLVPFAVGTETSGSIVSPSHNCRVTGLRPTFGSVSRYGAMALSWTMDKVGPICRSAEDCALVLAALLGEDVRDASSIGRGFEYKPISTLKGLRIGYLTNSEDDMKKPVDPNTKPWLKAMAEAGASFERFRFPRDVPGLFAIITAESGAAFDDLIRSPKIAELKNSAWPNSFREARFISAVDLIAADRARRKLMEQYERAITGFDAVVADMQGYSVVYQLNLTGHPQVLVPFGVDERGAAQSFSLIGQAFGEATLLAIADLIQRKTPYAKMRPPVGS